MAETTTLARPYARAAFEVASQDNALQSWSNLLALFAAVAKQPAVSSVLRDPSLPIFIMLYYNYITNI